MPEIFRGSFNYVHGNFHLPMRYLLCGKPSVPLTRLRFHGRRKNARFNTTEKDNVEMHVVKGLDISEGKKPNLQVWLANLPHPTFGVSSSSALRIRAFIESLDNSIHLSVTSLTESLSPAVNK